MHIDWTLFLADCTVYMSSHLSVAYYIECRNLLRDSVIFVYFCHSEVIDDSD
jgi:hypothetical protein